MHSLHVSDHLASHLEKEGGRPFGSVNTEVDGGRGGRSGRATGEKHAFVERLMKSAAAKGRRSRTATHFPTVAAVGGGRNGERKVEEKEEEEKEKERGIGRLSFKTTS